MVSYASIDMELKTLLEDKNVRRFVYLMKLRELKLNEIKKRALENCNLGKDPKSTIDGLRFDTVVKTKYAFTMDSLQYLLDTNSKALSVDITKMTDEEKAKCTYSIEDKINTVRMTDKTDIALLLKQLEKEVRLE